MLKLKAKKANCFVTWNEVLSAVHLGAAPESAPSPGVECCARVEFVSMIHEGEHAARAGGGASDGDTPQWRG